MKQIKENIKMVKIALFDRVINENCCSVDGGQAFDVFFCPHPGGFDSSRVPTPRKLPSKAKKCQCPGVSPGGGGGAGRRWNWLMH